ncbi:MarR family winged helix-turn-helix transcriptional regulator [Actinomadura macrotermitis]|uniref:HTH marR-type domain-containing protein n=1 Tax=Actinomadura macrotermitis TaxID=2585200 RepID=A0A7K0BY80_9ACTN|nr:MarR family transcriptional regulator [Actinomadura macrotermitis]MQY06150.1 hypothetical protein [Actinomadura macrotermitis]
MADAVDLIIEQWRRERPGTDSWPMGVVGRINRLSRLLDRELKDFFARYGLEFWEADVLYTLRRSGPPYALTAGALNRSSMVTSGAITNRIDRLAAKGLVERVADDKDRRTVLVRLTEQGHAKVEETIDAHVANEARILGALGPGARDELTGALRVLLEALDDTSLS